MKKIILAVMVLLLMSSCTSYMQTSLIVDSVKQSRLESYQYKVVLKQYNVATCLNDENVKIVDSPQYVTILTNERYSAGDTLNLK